MIFRVALGAATAAAVVEAVMEAVEEVEENDDADAGEEEDVPDKGEIVVVVSCSSGVGEESNVVAAAIGTHSKVVAASVAPALDDTDVGGWFTPCRCVAVPSLPSLHSLPVLPSSLLSFSCARY